MAKPQHISRVTPPRVKRSRDGEVPQQVIDAAEQVFAQKGFEAATMANVADAMHASRATLYYYVSSKDELLELVIRDFVAVQAERLHSLPLEGLEPEEQLRRVFAIALAPFGADADLARIFIREADRLPPQLRREQRTLERSIQKEVEQILEEGMKSGAFRRDLDPRLAALALFGMVNWLHVWYRHDRGFSIGAIAEAYADLFLGGVAQPRAATTATSVEATITVLRDTVDVLEQQLSGRRTRAHTDPRHGPRGE
jgi:AcrR family transcriptional regulator